MLENVAKDLMKGRKLTEIYNDSEGLDIRNKKIIYNANALRKKQQDLSGQQSTNFADQCRAVEDYMNISSFVRCAIRSNKKVPCIILYTEDQIADLKRFCCGQYSAMKTVLCVDKTFNLSDMHLTCTVYKNLSLETTRNGEPPLFLGPVFLHGNSDEDTFAFFFGHLSYVLFDACQKGQPPVFGSDEEKALRGNIKQER